MWQLVAKDGCTIGGVHCGCGRGVLQESTATSERVCTWRLARRAAHTCGRTVVAQIDVLAFKLCDEHRDGHDLLVCARFEVLLLTRVCRILGDVQLHELLDLRLTLAK